MARSPLPLGTWGRIHTRVEKTDHKGKPASYRAQAKYRDPDGVTRPVSAFGKTKTAAETNLLKKLKDRGRTGHGAELSSMHKIHHALELFEKKFANWVEDGKRSPTSLDSYRSSIKNHVLPALGELRLGEATTPRVDAAIAAIKKRAGASTAKTARSVISGTMRLAVQHGAISVNPVREVETIEALPKSRPRALTADEVHQLRTHLQSDERAVHADLPDLVVFMLGTGVRIGEAMAVLWSQVNLDVGTVKITDTIVRVKGQGLLRKRTKSRAGQRTLPLPQWTIAMLRIRLAAGIRLDEPIFADSISGFRDPSNVRRSLREALSPVGSTARRDLGFSLRAIRRESQRTRKEVADALEWPQTRIELLETGRIKTDRQVVTELLAHYGLKLEDSASLLAEIDKAEQPAPSDKLRWIRSHALRKTTATALDDQGQSPRQVADHLGHSRISMTQDHYLDRGSPNPSAAEALDRAFEDPEHP